jgi:RHS repeat-associated protein
MPVAQETLTTATTSFTFPDHVGTPFLQTTTNGTPTWRADVEPYGDVWNMRTGDPADQRLRFPGQEYDEQTPERAYNIFRWYRTGWGRYNQADPIGLRGGINHFAYTFDNPIRWTDPTGTCVCVFKGNIGQLTIAGNCKGKLPIWIIDEKGGPAAGAVGGTTVSADGFVLGGILYKIDGSVCVEIDCSGSGFAMSTCVNNIAYFLGKKEPYQVDWGTFGGPPKEPSSGAYPPVAK